MDRVFPYVSPISFFQRISVLCYIHTDRDPEDNPAIPCQFWLVGPDVRADAADAHGHVSSQSTAPLTAQLHLEWPKGVLCHAMPGHAMLCHAIPCHAMPCRARKKNGERSAWFRHETLTIEVPDSPALSAGNDPKRPRCQANVCMRAMPCRARKKNGERSAWFGHKMCSDLAP